MAACASSPLPHRHGENGGSDPIPRTTGSKGGQWLEPLLESHSRPLSSSATSPWSPKNDTEASPSKPPPPGSVAGDEEYGQTYRWFSSVVRNKLVLIRENKTWTEALRHCRDRDMDLVSVDSEQMQRRVMDVTSRASSDHVWLGLRHACALRFWFWVNGQTVCYNQWAPDYDTGLNDCDKTVRSGVIRTCDNRWISRPETDRYNFICINTIGVWAGFGVSHDISQLRVKGQTDITDHFSSSAPPIFGFPGWENSLLFFTSLFRFVSFFLGKGNSTEALLCVFMFKLVRFTALLCVTALLSLAVIVKKREVVFRVRMPGWGRRVVLQKDLLAPYHPQAPEQETGGIQGGSPPSTPSAEMDNDGFRTKPGAGGRTSGRPERV
ncbi:hypothetical protein cypCar_00042615 [Cyprinus carpio]|nr:hypothetical protein cypCar_00042615 [Cyprinus carpio]